MRPHGGNVAEMYGFLPGIVIFAQLGEAMWGELTLGKET
jgi:hypothetical protein